MPCEDRMSAQDGMVQGVRNMVVLLVLLHLGTLNSPLARPTLSCQACLPAFVQQSCHVLFYVTNTGTKFIQHSSHGCSVAVEHSDCRSVGVHIFRTTGVSGTAGIHCGGCVHDWNGEELRSRRHGSICTLAVPLTGPGLSS